jgi:hypothetical protein
MNKEFCNYTQSLALKELGFDEPCLTYYKNDGEFSPLPYEKEGFTLSDLDKAILSPLYQQAFRWFRDKYDLWCCIQKYPTSDNPKRCYYELKGDNINTDKDESPNSYMSGWFDSYEEAESACLDKLIEICRKK